MSISSALGWCAIKITCVYPWPSGPRMAAHALRRTWHTHYHSDIPLPVVVPCNTDHVVIRESATSEWRSVVGLARILVSLMYITIVLIMPNWGGHEAGCTDIKYPSDGVCQVRLCRR